MIKQLLNKLIPQRSKEDGFRIIEIDYSGVNAPIEYNDLFNRKVDGIIIRNFLNESEINQIKSNITKIPEDKFIWHDKRYKSIPPVFEYFFKYIENPKEYFLLCNKKENELRDYVKDISIEDRFIEWFTDFFSKEEKHIERIKLNSNMDFPFPTGCLRIIPPDYGKIAIHADNNFYPVDSPVFKDFSAKVNLSNHISCILTIQKADKGGNLILHNIDQLEYNRMSDDGLYVIHNQTNEKKLISSFVTREIIANEGDLVMFSGGRIWHSVSQMSGNLERITYGGFSALGKDDKTVFLWT